MDLFTLSSREAAVEELHLLTAIYTHDPVVDRLLDQLEWPSGTKRLLDPSVGAGAFLCRALDRLLRHQPSIDDAHLVHQVQGWEIHPLAAGQARHQVARVLQAAGRSADHAQRLAEHIVHIGDFLLDSEDCERFDAVSTNPPYLRMVNVPQEIRRDYEAVVPDFAQADMLHSFLAKCAKVLAPGGEIALITADRWLFNEGAAELRKAIGDIVSVELLERVDVDSAFYRPKLRKAGTPPRVHPVLVVLKQQESGGMPLTAAPIYPGAEKLEPSASGKTLADVANVRLAPWLGTPGVFVVDLVTAEGFRPDDLVPVVDTDDIRGAEMMPPTRYALRTFRDVEPHETVLRHLDANLHKMSQRARQQKVRWMPPEPFDGFDLSKERLLIPRIAKSLRPVRIPAGVLPINHNISVVSAGQYSLDEIEAVLCSKQADTWVKALAPRLENGYFSITTRFLRSLPL